MVGRSSSFPIDIDIPVSDISSRIYLWVVDSPIT